MGEVLVITSGKGGTGKTTLCAGIASCLAAMGQKVLAIDCDIGLNNLDIALGMTDCATVSFLDVMMENQYLSDAPEHPVIPGLQLLTAPTKTRAGLVDDIIFGRLIEEAAESYDWVLLDAPAGIGYGFDLATAYASRAILVATADAGSLRDAQQTAALLTEKGIKQIELVVNRVTRRLLNSVRSNIDDIMDHVGLPLLGLIPEDPIVPVAAANSSALVLRSRKGAAMACLRISRRLLGMDAPLMHIRY
ncbi:MAG: AAA family ATPase [Oscillospiraceae bacterium]|nr:AAA family ATPase [Oscillospiraceae bacterium]